MYKTCLQFYIVLVLSTSLASCAGADPVRAVSPTDIVRIELSIPKNIAVEGRAIWRTTSKDLECEDHEALRGSFAKVTEVPVTPRPVPGNQVWVVYRDHFLPGSCQWRLDEVLVWADKVNSDFPPKRAENLANRPLVACTGSISCGTNNWADNSDTDKSVFLYCKFSSLKNLPKGYANNPCQYERDKYRGTDGGKMEHLLMRDGHLVKVVFVDLETSE